MYPRNEPAVLSQRLGATSGKHDLGQMSTGDGVLRQYVPCSWMSVEHILMAATALSAEVTLLTLEVLLHSVMQNL